VTAAAGVDRFSPIRIESEFFVNIPDPARSGHDLVTPQGEPIRYEGRTHLLVIDD
jgi:hypothetical protein